MSATSILSRPSLSHDRFLHRALPLSCPLSVSLEIDSSAQSPCHCPAVGNILYKASNRSFCERLSSSLLPNHPLALWCQRRSLPRPASIRSFRLKLPQTPSQLSRSDPSPSLASASTNMCLNRPMLIGFSRCCKIGRKLHESPSNPSHRPSHPIHISYINALSPLPYAPTLSPTLSLSIDSSAPSPSRSLVVNDILYEASASFRKRLHSVCKICISFLFLTSQTLVSNNGYLRPCQ